ncbi:unnamed protein product [Rotaria sp. Silwood1]|nr:unnamed protein product [Rotaria sp. Silwood1]CAF1628869.1 unnamed protein product [Rotaria sp. Silwood1]CAF3836170.1 unnamed protein product [Rotaria sp. Silwood1]CAF4899795.1 unnamed protein product [Rotaria sp. Silwood1]
MSNIGLCTDITCDNSIKELYKCHCCLQVVCLNHLIEHVEITKQNKQRLDNVRYELNTIITTLKSIVESKLSTIEREQNLIEQGKRLLDASNSSIDEIQNIFEQINQAIQSNCLDVIVKVEPLLSETKSCSTVGQCNKENINSNVEESEISENDRCSTFIDHDFIDISSIDEPIKSIKDQDMNKEKRKGITTVIGQCPLTFDGAYGLTEAKHSIKFCEHTKTRPIRLYNHFIGKHRLKPYYARRLIRAIINNKEPKITKLFDENENVVYNLCKVSCPFTKKRILLPGLAQPIESKVQCRCHKIPLNALKSHLRDYHHVSDAFAKDLFECMEEIRNNNDTTST